MKKNIDNLYIAKVRRCIMDIVNHSETDKKEVFPRSNYIEYYTIIYNKKNKLIDLNNIKETVAPDNDLINNFEFYKGTIVLEMYPLKDYLTQKRVSLKEGNTCIEKLITQKTITNSYGYKNK